MDIRQRALEQENGGCPDLALPQALGRKGGSSELNCPYGTLAKACLFFWGRSSKGIMRGLQLLSHPFLFDSICHHVSKEAQWHLLFGSRLTLSHMGHITTLQISSVLPGFNQSQELVVFAFAFDSKWRSRLDTNQQKVRRSKELDSATSYCSVFFSLESTTIFNTLYWPPASRIRLYLTSSQQHVTAETFLQPLCRDTIYYHYSTWFIITYYYYYNILEH